MLLLLPTLVTAWGDGHRRISTAALPLQPPDLQALLHNTSATFLGVTASVADFLTGLVKGSSDYDWSEIPDIVAGPCQATRFNCTAIQTSAKLTYREFCYAENASAAYAVPSSPSSDTSSWCEGAFCNVTMMA